MESSDEVAYMGPSDDSVFDHQFLDEAPVLLLHVRLVFLLTEPGLLIPADGEGEESALLRSRGLRGRLAGRGDVLKRGFGRLGRHDWLAWGGGGRERSVSLSISVALFTVLGLSGQEERKSKGVSGMMAFNENGRKSVSDDDRRQSSSDGPRNWLGPE